MPEKSSHHPDPRLYGTLRALARFLFRLLTRLEIRGIENIPQDAPYLAITNHLSAIDPPLILALFPRPITVFAADTHRHEFIVGEIMHRMGAIWVKRGEVDREALRAALQVLKEGGVIGLAPEGTRSRTGGLLKGKIGAAYIAAYSKVPLVPVALTGTEIGLPAVFRFTRPRITVTIGPPFQLRDCGGRPSRQDLDEYTDTIMLTLAHMLPEKYRGVYQEAAAEGQKLNANSE
jgi:1-acyl-sn-glycerol-3-phosphate acyltransferase